MNEFKANCHIGSGILSLIKHYKVYKLVKAREEGCPLIKQTTANNTVMVAAESCAKTADRTPTPADRAVMTPAKHLFQPQTFLNLFAQQLEDAR